MDEKMRGNLCIEKNKIFLLGIHMWKITSM